MAYVQISDPAIIDLAAWHQVINVVNQHSDSIAALSNNFGMSWSANYDDDNWSSPFDFGSCMIEFGRVKILASQIQAETLNGIEVGYAEEVVNFNSGSFSNNPVITATVYTGASSGYKDSTDINISIKTLGPDSFTVTAVFAGQQDPQDTPKAFYINWIAIGPK